ncbi:hypothetical protein [Streptomyces sp. 4F14]|uniref:hypothetical protein n=1 Tax=Streptomyces sp. 4F14 TaxID=3394380 RepID=UPI003A8BBE59
MTAPTGENSQPATGSTEGNPAETSPGLTLEELTADRDRWKAMSLQNETNYNSARTELQELQTAQEAALEAARGEARTAALGEVSTELVTAELRLQAQSAGRELPDLKYLDYSRFKGEHDRPDTEAVKAFVEALKPTDFADEFPDLIGGGHNKGGNGQSVLTTNDPTALADYIAGDTFI